MKSILKHNSSPLGASTQVKYSLGTFNNRENAILSTDLKNITLVNNENKTIFSVPFNEIQDFKRRENTLEVVVSDQRFIIQFGDNAEYVAPFSALPSLASSVGSRVMVESGQVYWTELISKHVPITTDSSAINRLGWTSKLDAIIFKIIIVALSIILVFWLFSLVF